MLNNLIQQKYRDYSWTIKMMLILYIIGFGVGTTTHTIDNIKLSDVNADCIKLAKKISKTSEYNKSKLYQLKVGMDSIRNSGDINISEVASVILRTLSPKDFENEYYKMTALLMLATTQDADSGIIRRLPSISNEKEIESIDKRNLILVYITTDNDSVLLNNKKVAIAHLTDIVRIHIISDSTDTTKPELIPMHIDLIGDCYQSKLIISLQNDRKTSYNTYIKVQNELARAYKKVRNEKALEYFNLEFEKLTDVQKGSIKKLIPMRISEAKPTQ